MKENWLPVKEVSELTGKSERHVRRYATSAKIGKDFVVVRTETGSTGEQYEFLLDSLPEGLKLKYWHKAGIEGAINVGIHPDKAEAYAERLKKIPGTKVIPKKYELDEAEFRWLGATDKQRAKAQDKLEALRLVEKMVLGGMRIDPAITAVAKQMGKGFSKEAIYKWKKRVKGWPKTHHIYALLDGFGGGAERIEIDPEFWGYIAADYFRLEAPALTAVYDRVNKLALMEGLPTYPYKTVLRRINEVSTPIHVLAREGPEAAMQLYPAQERDRSVFHALEAVNADGHKFDVLIKWPDGEEGRVVLTAWQDIRSGKILSYRLTKTENSDSVRLSFGDMMMEYGIPEHAYLDNGRGFASKWLTGGMKTRFRFKVKEDEPEGILTMLGVEVHWATPYHGQAKPIERAFRDLCERISKHPTLAGAYTGKDPVSKPANYGEKRFPMDVFEAVVAEEITSHNARTGRRSKICAGRSFDQSFKESYDQAKAAGKIRTASERQKLFCMMTGEEINPNRKSGELKLFDNRYWSEEMNEFRTQKVTVRFDPDHLYEGLWVFTNKGQFICHAPCVFAAGFNDTQAARDHNRARNQFLRAQKDQLKALTKMDVAAAMKPCLSGNELREMDVESALAARALKERVALEATGRALPKAAEPELRNEIKSAFNACMENAELVERKRPASGVSPAIAAAMAEYEEDE